MVGGLRFRTWTWVGRSVVAAGVLLVLLSGPSRAGAAQATALAVQVGTPAQAVFGSDGREHVDYDLVISNVFTVPVKLRSIRVFNGNRPVLTLSGKGLLNQTLLLTTPTTTIPVSSFVKTLVDVVMPRSSGRRIPRRLTEQISYTLPRNAPGRAIIGSTVIDGPVVPVNTRAPIEIASPLLGAGWLNSNGCCADPTSEHRTLLLPADGSFRTPELFAIDWIREVGGFFFAGNGTKLTDWAGFGAQIHAVAGGVVVSTINNRPEVAPFTTTDKNRSVRTPKDFAGNEVVERIAPGKYAVYLHLQTGSVSVRAGQRLSTGQVIGLLGNTGNTTGPHLHFGIQDGPDILTSNSLPFEIRSFTVVGSAAVTGSGALKITGPPRQATLALPLIRSVFNF